MNYFDELYIPSLFFPFFVFLAFTMCQVGPGPQYTCEPGLVPGLGEQMYDLGEGIFVEPSNDSQCGLGLFC